MNSRKSWLILVFLVLPLAGCPLITPQNRTFMSADTGQNAIFDGTGAEAGGDGEAPSVDDGGVQREVVEPDVIRRQGNLLYVLNQYRGLTIVDLDTDTLLTQVATLGYPRDLYFSNGQAYVLVGYAQDVTVAEGGAIGVSSSARVYAVDVSNPAGAAIRSSIDLTGDLVDSRLVGDVLYAVSAEYNYGFYEDVAFAGNASSTTVTSIDVSDPAAIGVADQLTFEGSGNVIHVTPEFAFVATPDWQDDATDITCLDITDPGGAIQNAGAVRVRGYVDDRFKIDAWNGALRVVSSAWGGQNQVYLSTFDLTQASLPRLAEMRLEGAEGERLFATRFDGPRAYVVTYFVVDPLFVLDVSDPAAPQLLGALEVPGYSTYIEPRGDRLIALGVDNTNGQKVSVSIFDVSGEGAPTLLDRASFGEDWSWSNAYSDVKALTILDDVIMVPFSGWSGTAGGFERLQFVSYTQDTLQLRGAVDLSGSILRSFDYNAFYYGVTTEQVTRINGDDLDHPVVESSITIAENVVDYLEFNADLAAEVVVRYDEGQVLVRTVDGGQNPLGELVLDAGNFLDAYQSGNTLVIVGAVWEDKPGYVVSIIDLENPESPALRNKVAVDVYPYYYYYYYDYGFGGPELDGVPGAAPGAGGGATATAKDVAIGIFPYYYYGGEARGFLLGDTLALRCSADRFDSTLGEGTAYQGLALVNLATGEWESTVGLGYDAMVSLNAIGDKLYLGTKESLGAAPFQRAMAAYYLRELDILQGVAGPAANVPGAFVQYDPASDVLTLNDHQWSSDGSVASSLETVRWSGGDSVTPLDSVDIAGYPGRMLATGGRVYFDRYENGYQIYQATIGGDGALSLGAPVEAGYYGSLLGARGDDVIASIGYGALAHYTFSEGAGELAALVPVSGYPATIRFGSGAAYVPLGYFGVAVLPL